MRIAPHNLKSISAIFHVLVKVGKEIIIEAEREHLVFRTLNDGKSSFAAIDFDVAEFFEEFYVDLKADETEIAFKM